MPLYPATLNSTFYILENTFVNFGYNNKSYITTYENKHPGMEI